MKSIADMCKELDVTPRTLRFWESQDLVTSTRDTVRGRRLYDEVAQTKLRQVADLRGMGVPVRAIYHAQRGDRQTLRAALVGRLEAATKALADTNKQVNQLERALAKLPPIAAAQ